MSIIRADRRDDDPWERILRATLEDTRLSYEATGVLVMLLAKPDGWVIRRSYIQTARAEDEHGVGRDQAQRILNELKAAGYLRVVVGRDESGAFSSQDYVLHGRSLETNTKEGDNVGLPGRLKNRQTGEAAAGEHRHIDVDSDLAVDSYDVTSFSEHRQTSTAPATPAVAGIASSGERLTERATATATAEAHRPGADHDFDLVLPWEDHGDWPSPQARPGASPAQSAPPEAPQEDSHAPVVMTSSDPKWLLLSTIALDTGCGWGRQEKAPGKLRAHIGQLWGELGRRLGDDPVLALVVWEEFAGGLKQHAPSKLAPGSSVSELRLWLGGRFGRAAIARARGA